MLQLDLRTARDDMRGLREDTEAAQKKAGVLEIAKVPASTSHDTVNAYDDVR